MAPGMPQAQMMTRCNHRLVIDSLLRLRRRGGKLEASEFVYGHTDKNQASLGAAGRKRPQSVDDSEEFAGRMRAALVKAMEAGEVKNSPSSFTTLSD